MPTGSNEPPISGARRGYIAPHDETPSTSTPRYAADPALGGTYGGTPDFVGGAALSSGSTSADYSTRTSTAGKPASARPARPDRRFVGAIVRTVAGTIVPGLGFLGTRAHRLGMIILTALLVGTVALGFTIIRNPLLTAGSVLRSDWARTIGFVLIIASGLWVMIIMGTYLISRPRTLTPRQRAIGAGVVSVMSLLVSAPLAVASAYSFETATLSGGLFQSEDDKGSQTRPTLDVKDPWENKPRVNLLLLGGDSGEGREEGLGVRTDTMMLASIDTSTGATLIIQLPRNLQRPIFPPNSALRRAFPYGFDNGGDSMLNAVWNDVPNLHPELFEDTDYPGADALKWAVEGVTGLPVDYFVLVNIDGLVNLVDAMGGVWLNINFPIAIGGSDEWGTCGEGGWIPEGPGQLLNGYEAMWYARSRCNSPGSDFGRMQRQSCLVKAVIDQADPATMAIRYEGIAKAAGDMVSTDIPQEHLSAIVELAGRVQKAQVVQRLTFVDGMNGFSSSWPDFELMQQQVEAAIAATMPASAAPDAPAEPAPAPETTEAPAPAEPQPETQGGQYPETPETSAPPAENVADACAYRHEEPAGHVPIPETVPVYTPSPAEEPR